MASWFRNKPSNSPEPHDPTVARADHKSPFQKRAAREDDHVEMVQETTPTVERTSFSQDQSSTGVFLTIDEFMSDNATRELSSLQYELAHQISVGPACIIYVDDEAGHPSRIHQRIMLVYKSCGQKSLVCYSFYKHKRPLTFRWEKRTNKNVYEFGSSHLEDTQAIFIKPLFDGSHLVNGITIDLEEVWTVKSDVKVAILGQVPDEKWSAVRNQITDLFITDSRQSTPTPAPAEQDSLEDHEATGKEPATTEKDSENKTRWRSARARTSTPAPDGDVNADREATRKRPATSGRDTGTKSGRGGAKARKRQGEQKIFGIF